LNLGSVQIGREFTEISEYSRRTTMQWEKPEYFEISLACEISSYANAQLGDSTAQAEGMRDGQANERQK